MIDIPRCTNPYHRWIDIPRCTIPFPCDSLEEAQRLAEQLFAEDILVQDRDEVVLMRPAPGRWYAVIHTGHLIDTVDALEDRGML